MFVASLCIYESLRLFSGIFWYTESEFWKKLCFRATIPSKHGFYG